MIVIKEKKIVLSSKVLFSSTIYLLKHGTVYDILLSTSGHEAPFESMETHMHTFGNRITTWTLS